MRRGQTRVQRKDEMEKKKKKRGGCILSGSCKTELEGGSN